MVRKGRRKEFGKFTKKIAAVGLALAMTVSTAIPTYAYYGFSGEFTRSERLTQTRVSSTFSKDELGVVNFETTWGDKQANIASMDEYIEEADKKGVKVLVFPEMCVTGKTPKIIETKWGKIGVDICRDGHFYPELGRYYAAMGCTMFVHPTATTGNAWYRSTRIGSYVDRDGMAAITCNLLGGDGIYVADGAYTYSPDDIDENGDFVGGSAIPETIYNQNEIEDDPYWNSRNWLGTGGVFNSTSFIATKGSTASTALKPRINYNGTGAYSEGFEERGNTSPLGLEIADMDLTGTGFSGTESTFKPALYAKLYDKLATLYRGGYVSKIKDKDNSGTTPETTTARDSATKTTEPKTTENKKVATFTLTYKTFLFLSLLFLIVNVAFVDVLVAKTFLKFFVADTCT
jgi:hypothetical protein